MPNSIATPHRLPKEGPFPSGVMRFSTSGGEKAVVELFEKIYDDHLDKYTLRDWACDLALLRDANRDDRTHQEWWIRDHVYCLEAAEDAALTAEPVAVLQGHDLE
jgi:hypothetical protein